MTEEEANNVNNQEAVIPDANLESPSPEQVTKESTSTDSKEYNWRQMEKRNDALERQVNELTRLENERNSPPPPKVDEELNSLADDDIITVAQARKLSEKQAEELITKALAQREKASLPERTRSKFTDFDAILTTENIKKLETEEPGLADACAKATNPWEATYKVLKKFIVPQKDEKSIKNDEKMKENLSRPASSNSVGRSGPLNDANTWAEASKGDLYSEMMQAARSAR